jgi:hypothetical protein
MRGEGGSHGVSANEYSFAHGSQINFGDLTPYLTYDLSYLPLLLSVDFCPIKYFSSSAYYEPVCLAGVGVGCAGAGGGGGGLRGLSQ